jgi:hypothetical protein
MHTKKHKDLTYKDIILNKELYSQELIKHKLVGFERLNLTADEYKNLVLEICFLNKKSDEKFYLVEKNNHQNLYQPNKKTLSKLEIDNFKKWCMHVDVDLTLTASDNVLEDNLHTSYVSMYMRTFKCDKSFGKTLLLDLTKMYDNCPNYFKSFLLDATLEHHLAEPEEFNLNTQTQFVENDAKSIPVIFFPFRTHPITKETILFWPTYSSTKLHGGLKQWFEEFKEWIKQQLDDNNNWYTWDWDEGDVLIFDNRCMIHTFTPGWDPSERIFDQIIAGFEKPYYDSIKVL